MSANKIIFQVKVCIQLFMVALNSAPHSGHCSDLQRFPQWYLVYLLTRLCSSEPTGTGNLVLYGAAAAPGKVLFEALEPFPLFTVK